MKTSEIRNWLGIYFLFTTVCLGAYILLFKETLLLPINGRDSMDAFQIIIPVFVAQLTTIFQWFGGTASMDKDDSVPIPVWIVKIPPLLVIVVIVATIISMVLSEHFSNHGSWIDASTFKAVVTFCVTILNATTIVIVAKVFRKDRLPD